MIWFAGAPLAGALFTFRPSFMNHLKKNWTHVRKIFGYQRIDTPRQVEMMNDLYQNELRLFDNFFMPVRKLKEKVKKGQRNVGIYDDPQTPLKRVLKAAGVVAKLNDSSIPLGLHFKRLKSQYCHKPEFMVS
ncbi:MAG: hypothetical protein ACM3WV_02335 [Bacillota bacterium]